MKSIKWVYKNLEVSELCRLKEVGKSDEKGKNRRQVFWNDDMKSIHISDKNRIFWGKRMWSSQSCERKVYVDSNYLKYHNL